MEWIAQPQAWVALATLTALEIVLGIDNIVFISILAGRLPSHQRNKARTLGLALAMVTRILLLLALTWIMTLTAPLFHVFKNEISGRDIILLAGGLFLLAKSTHEIHASLEGKAETTKAKAARNFVAVLVQIAVLDIVFSLDSVITAVGLADHIPVMILAIMIAVGVMMLSARVIGNFVDTHPTIKMLALSFLLLVGFSLMGEGLNLHIPKGYIYFAMAFSLGVEILNLKVRERAAKPVRLRKVLEE
ncbi:MAG: TerC family protein [Candidatus Aminicenantes bacterium]|nr:MAG: TerC family protein [Candidatus Aminicenantes bacterium]